MRQTQLPHSHSKVDENPSEEKNVLDPLEVANAHFSGLQAPTKTKPNRFQRSLRNLAEPFPGTEAGKAKSSPEMSRNEH